MSEMARDVSNALVASAHASVCVAQVYARLLVDAERECARLAEALGKSEERCAVLERERNAVANALIAATESKPIRSDP